MIQHLRFDCPLREMKADPSGQFSGLAAGFNNVDSWGDKIVPGAFLQQIVDQGVTVPILWQHNTDWPIGKTTDMYENNRGLQVTGQLALATTQGKDAYEVLKADIPMGLSIGFNALDYSYEGDVRVLSDIELWEISLVTFPANDKARVTSVKSIETIRDFEKLLLKDGLSRTEARAVAASGFKQLSALRDAAPIALREAEHKLATVVRDARLLQALERNFNNE